MDRQVYKCECGYVTHFEKALEAHCRFRHHHPAADAKPVVKAEAETILPEIEAEVVKAVKRQAKAAKAETQTVKKTTRKPRATKAAKEQK